MADRKISDLTALTTPASGDYLPIVDISEAAAASKNKRITIEELFRGVPLGTAAAPSIAIEGNENTGVYSPGANQLAVATNGTGRLFVDASGNVGIGISPAYTFHVSSSSTSSAAFKNPGAANTQILVGNTAGDTQLRTLSTGDGLILSDTGKYLAFGTNGGSERLRITSAGLVGIGTSSPSQLLTTVGNIKIAGAQASNIAKLCLTRTDTSWSINNETDLRFYYGNSDTDSPSTLPVVFTSTGRVGIGSTAPVGTLHVVGDTSALGEYSVLSVADVSDATKAVRIAYDDVNDVGIITASDTGTGWKDLVLQPISGRVGIGAINPGFPLDLVSASGQSMRIRGTSGTEVSKLLFASNTAGTDYGYLTSASGYLAFGYGASERGRFDSSGRLLVGTSSTSTNLRALIQATSANSAGSGNFYLARGESTPANGVTLGYLGFSDSNHTSAAGLEAVRDGGTWTSGSSQPSRLVFSVTADAASSPTEALRISSNRAITVSDGGNVVLGTTTGTKIGTATTQKLGFYNATPVVQPAAVADATDAATVITQLNALLAKLRTLGIIAT